MRPKRLSSLLGLAFEGGRMTAVLLRRAGQRLHVHRALNTALSLDPMTDDPELVGREIRTCLEQANIRESRCMVCVPLKWVLTLRAELPDLSDEDVRNFLNVQAEREFPFAPEDLSISVSHFHTLNGKSGATVAAIPMHHLTALQQSLQAAKLRPLGMTLGITSLLEADATAPVGTVTLLVGDSGIDLAISIGRGVIALRALDETDKVDEAPEEVDATEVARQIRITLGQLPRNGDNSFRVARVFGPADQAGALAAALREPLGRMGMAVAIGDATAALEATDPAALAGLSPGALGVASDRLLGQFSDFEFMPTRTSRLKQITGRISSRATRWLAVAAALLVLGLSGAFIYQHWRLSRLESRWSRIEADVGRVAAIQENVRQFRPWFDDSNQSLRIARVLTEAFPEDGAVWAKSLEIREPQDSDRPLVTCSGKALSDREWRRMFERLGETKGVEDLQFQQVRGEEPLQFTLTFRWNAGEADGV